MKKKNRFQPRINIKNKKGNIISDSSALRRGVRGYKQFYVYTFENLDGMGKFLEKKKP